MGYMCNHTLVVSSWDENLVARAHDTARAMLAQVNDGSPNGRTFTQLLSNICPAAINGGGSFMIAPDFSKEGWATSDAMDDFRTQYIEWLESQRYGDGSTSLGYVEVQFDDDEKETKITRSSDTYYLEHEQEFDR